MICTASIPCVRKEPRKVVKKWRTAPPVRLKIPLPQSQREVVVIMEWLKSKTTLVAGGCLALIGLQGYGMMSMRNTMEERVSSVERELQSMHNQDNARVAQLTSDLDVVTKRMGI